MPWAYPTASEYFRAPFHIGIAETIRRASLNLPGTRKSQPGGVALSSSIGESLEFEIAARLQIRAIRIRRIHWRSWARTGKLIVKEFQDEILCAPWLGLDTFPSSQAPPEILKKPFRSRRPLPALS